MTLSSLVRKLEPVERLFLFVIALWGVGSMVVTIAAFFGVGPIPTPAGFVKELTDLRAQVAENTKALGDLSYDLCLRLTDPQRRERRMVATCRQLVEGK